MTGKKRKSKSKGVPASKRKRFDVSFSESGKDEVTQPTTSSHFFVGEGYKSWTKEDVAKKLEDNSLNRAAEKFKGKFKSFDFNIKSKKKLV